MRGWLVISVLALASCGEHRGWNPNYQFGTGPYGEYRAEREVALVSGTDSPQVIPVARPFEAPTPAEIAGRSPVPVPATMGVRAASQSDGNAQVQIVPDNMLPKAQTGPYPGSTPVLVRYAFTADHQPGIATYSRGSGSQTQAARACASYASVDAAQTAFLAAGGPQRDPRGMDPDGDGFVCGWDPAPFRKSQL